MDDVWRALDATWPAETKRALGPFVWRGYTGESGGSRVTAATCATASGDGISDRDLDAIEQEFSRENRTPLFRVHDAQEPFDSQLAARGYAIADPTLCFVCAASDIDPPPQDTGYACWPPLSIQRDIWREGGITAARRGVMERAEAPRTTFLGRVGELPAGTCFAAVSNGIAMVHALEVRPQARRKSVARHMMSHAAEWASENGAQRLAVLVTRANTPACKLYSSLGMTVRGHYHYRKRVEN